MRNYLPIILTGVVLTACSTDSQTTSPAKTVFQIRSTYVSVLTLAEGYEGLPRCPETTSKVCSDPDVVDIIRKSDLTAKDALDAAETTVRSHPELDATFAISAADNAVAALQNILTRYEVTP